MKFNNFTTLFSENRTLICWIDRHSHSKSLVFNLMNLASVEVFNINVRQVAEIHRAWSVFGRIRIDTHLFGSAFVLWKKQHWLIIFNFNALSMCSCRKISEGQRPWQFNSSREAKTWVHFSFFFVHFCLLPHDQQMQTNKMKRLMFLRA